MSQVEPYNNQPLVSVIIPVYNMQDYLTECVTSVLASTYTPLEVVIVDDGSTDGSLAVAHDLAAADERVVVVAQANSGVSSARNHAIEEARGEFVLPVDGDDRIAPHYIEHALRHFEADPDVKVVTACGEFFGNRTGRWELPAFDLHLLARRNLISVCALYRKAHWAQAGGYCTYIKGLEDWDFWISMLKDGGKVVQMPEVGFYYRIRAHSKRIADRKHKAAVVATLNERHPEFFKRELGGPLHVHRSWSRWLNRLHNCKCRLLHKN